MPFIKGNSVKPEEFILYHRQSFDEGLIDIHEFGRQLRKAAEFNINKTFLQSQVHGKSNKPLTCQNCQARCFDYNDNVCWACGGNIK